MVRMTRRTAAKFPQCGSENGLPGDGIMKSGLDILQKLPDRYPGLFDGPFHLCDGAIRNLAGHDAESGLFRCHVVPAPAPRFRVRGTPPRSACSEAIRDLPGPSSRTAGPGRREPIFLHPL